MDKPVITLLEYVRKYSIKRIVNVQSVIDKCTCPLTHTATRIIEAIKKEAHLLKVQWNGGVSLLKYGFGRDVPPPKAWKLTCPTTLLSLNHHVQIGRPKKKRKMSKLKDGPFMKDGGNNKEASGSASRQAQQAKPVLGQDGSGASD
ncbi:hypothetical protein Tco_1353268 [Tanacetum coccineum]